MKIHLIRIGNSFGIRLPKAVLDQCQFKDVIDAEIVDGKLILTSPKNCRQGWEESFKAMAKNGDDTLLDDVKPTFDEEEWQW